MPSIKAYLLLKCINRGLIELTNNSDFFAYKQDFNLRKRQQFRYHLKT